MHRILIGAAEFPFVDDAGREEIRRRRAALRPILERDRCPLTREGRKLRLHTYAGGRINATISALLEAAGLGRIPSFGDLAVDLEPAVEGPIGEKLIQRKLRELRDVDSRFSPAERANLVGSKSRGKLAKFQPYLPPVLEGSYVAERLFDFEGTARLAGNSMFPVVR